MEYLNHAGPRYSRGPKHNGTSFVPKLPDIQGYLVTVKTQKAVGMTSEWSQSRKLLCMTQEWSQSRGLLCMTQK